jgi:sec-independent protein translocase protein TatC
MDKSSSDTELAAGHMPFVEHLRELRDRVRNAAIAFVVAFGVCWYFSRPILTWLREPLDVAWAQHADKLGPMPHMAFGSLTEPFWVYMSIGLWAGVFLASPFIFHQLWQFIAPGLYKKERRFGILFALASAVCFVAGALFCHTFVMHPMFGFLLGYADKTLHPTLFLGQYLELARSMMLAFGAVFEMPMLIFFLAMIGLVTHRGLWKFNRWFIVIAFVIGAVLTPSPDVVSQLMMAMPMIVLYNLSIVIAYIVGKRREKAASPSPH